MYHPYLDEHGELHAVLPQGLDPWAYSFQYPALYEMCFISKGWKGSICEWWILLWNWLAGRPADVRYALIALSNSVESQPSNSFTRSRKMTRFGPLWKPPEVSSASNNADCVDAFDMVYAVDDSFGNGVEARNGQGSEIVLQAKGRNKHCLLLPEAFRR